MIRSAAVEAPGDRNAYEVESHFDVTTEQYVSLEPARRITWTGVPPAGLIAKSWKT